MRAAFAIVVFTAVSAIAQAQNRATVVYPTGIWPDDGHNVSVAASGGGTVVLKAVNTAGVPTAFNFGDQFIDRCVVLLDTADVKIIGERMGRSRTTIHGGCSAFRVHGPIAVTIQGIDFDGPFADAIEVDATTGADIIDNHILSVRPVRFFFGTYADGFDIFGIDSQALSGTIRLLGNTIENLAADFEAGVQVDDNVFADIVISGNDVTIAQTPGTGRIESDGLLVIRCHRPARIEGNHVFVGPNFAYDGIAIGGDSVAPFRVTGNSVVSYSPEADGIVLIGGFFNDGVAGAVVDENSVEMHDSQFGAISAYGQVTDSEIRANRISGDSAWAFGAQGFGFVGSSNRFLQNNLARHTSTLADVVFDAFTHDNIVDGMCDSFIDDGTNNVITCRGHGSSHGHAPPWRARGLTAHPVRTATQIVR
ncbi:MAG TPA: hypothetical protein VKL19_16825 [Thermoanaerobaculia bacterium]|nr:hypothetical protein [Thermoanaerobaculia bacterium]